MKNKYYGQTITYNALINGNGNGILNSNINNSLYQEIFIKKLIHGIFLKFNYLTSDIQIKNYATGEKEITFMFLLNPIASRAPRSTSESMKDSTIRFGAKLKMDTSVNIHPPLSIKNLIKAIITLKFGFGYKFTILQAPSLWSNPKLVADFINFQISKDPRQHKFVLTRLSRDFKKITQDPR